MFGANFLTISLIFLSVADVGGIFQSDDYQPAIADTDGERDDLIKKYFSLGYSYKEILVALLCNHEIRLGLRQLKRVLKKMGLRRRLGVYSPIADVITAILHEVNGSGKCLGYRSMWKRLSNEHGLRVQRNTVLELMWLIDEEGVQRRKAKRLLKRRYCTPGPNFMWHIDGYDKLKPYGFAIHGAIDGYSRKILWLRVGVSNNNPLIVAGYYLQCLELYQQAPRILRCDLGTENTTLKLLQPYFRYHCEDRFAGLNSIIMGKSTSNQRIEAWWAHLRKQNTDYWITYFKDLRDSGVYNDGNFLHMEALKFCFMPVIQSELNRVVKEWNTHIISKKRNAEGPNGKPDFMYFCPEYYGTQNYGCLIETDDVDACKDVYGINNGLTLPCTAEFLELVDELLPDARFPTTETEALELFVQLTDLFDNL